MRKATMGRLGLLGSVAALGLMSSVGGAQAYQTKFGEFEVTFDTTFSVGASMKTADRDTRFLPESNGGPVDPRLSGVVLVPTLGLLANGGAAQQNLTSNQFNYDGSVNGDDGRLNFDNGDLIGAPIKASHDLLVKYQNFTLFARGVGFYDAILSQGDIGAHSDIDAAQGAVGRNYKLLDLYLSGDFEVADLPVNIRVGRQVISWGEGTFILNGNNIFNPIDVTAFRRPGSEIKEALLPLNAVFGSVQLPANFSLAAYYALDWDKFEIDPSGTPFSGADVVRAGSGIGGNRMVSFVTGGPFAGNRRNCDRLAGGATTTVQDLFLGGNPTLPGLLNNGRLDCSDTSTFGPAFANMVNYSTPYTIGSHEAVRLGLVDLLGADDGMTFQTQAGLTRAAESDPDAGGQFGVTLRNYNDDLGIETALYFQRYHSRLPYVGIRSAGSGGDLAFFTNGNSLGVSGVSGRALPLLGRGLSGATFAGYFNAIPAIAKGTATAAGNGAGNAIGAFAGNVVTPGSAAAQMATTAVSDPSNLLPNFVAQLAANGFGGLNVHFDPVLGFKNQLAVAQLNSVLAWYQSSGSALGLPAGTGITINGAELLNMAGKGEVFVTYPEDLDVYGASFNTTVWGWGVQGEVSYRPNAGFQADTDALTIQSLVAGCTFHTLFFAAGGQVAAGQTPDGSGNVGICGANQKGGNPVIENEMFTAQIGTTASFTGSEWWVEAIGADQAIFLTEFGMVHVPDVEATWISNGGGNRAQYQNTGCQGTDLPLGGILDLDTKSSAACRPTDTSAGYVLVARLDYNNAFNSGFLLTPTFAFSHDFYGTTPSPFGNYLQDRMSASASVAATLNNNFRVNLGYTNFWGGHINNKAQDQDFVSLSAQYSF
jgi:hypothetical protein